MGGKRTAQPSGNAQGQEAASGDGAASQGGASRKRQTRELRVDGAAAASAEGGSSGQEESGSTLSHVTICVSTRHNPRVLAGRKAALEAALRKVLSEFGGRDCRVEWTRVGPSEDTLQRVLPLVLERVEPEGGAHLVSVCKAWRREMEARGVCRQTVQLCSALAEGGDVARLGLNAERRLNASTGDDAERAVSLDCSSFLAKMLGQTGCLHEWLQAASQEPDASFLSRGAVSTAQSLGLHMVRWAGKPQGRYPRSYTLPVHSYMRIVAFSPDGTRVVSGPHGTLVKIWDVETGQEVRTLRGHSGGVASVAFSTDGKRITSGSTDNLVRIWNAETGAKVRTLTGHFAWVEMVAFSSDGKRIVSGSHNGRVKIWNIETGAQVRTLSGNIGCGFNMVAISPDGKSVACASTNRLVKIWNIETGAEVHSMRHSLSVHSVAFSADGKLVVSGSRDGIVKIWNAETGGVVHTLGHSCTGTCICTMQENDDGEQEIVRVHVRNPACPVTGHSDTVLRVQFSHDGAQVISGSSDNTVRFWDVASGAHVRQLAGRIFTLVEGPSDTHQRSRHILTVLGDGDTLRIYEVAKEPQHAEGGGAANLVACFKAPQPITSVRCHGAAICVGCLGGRVCILSAPFLTA